MINNRGSRARSQAEFTVAKIVVAPTHEGFDLKTADLIDGGSLPAHLPRIEIVVDIDDKAYPCCRGELHRIGEDKSERLEIVPAQFRVLVTRRPKYACRKCEDGVLQAPGSAPD